MTKIKELEGHQQYEKGFHDGARHVIARLAELGKLPDEIHWIEQYIKRDLRDFRKHGRFSADSPL